ncbi:MAG TPA: transglycosylase domain-containing protein [Patescibacteria group bacterium]|nr:transglycosylase domain-containing protein [Patescibacteria group bacterium]
MSLFPIRAGRPLVYVAVGALALCAGALAARPLLERRLRTWIETGAARHGLVARIDAVHVGLWPPVRVTGVALDSTRSVRLNADTVEVWWPAHVRVVAHHAVAQGPAGLTVTTPSMTWDVTGLAGGGLRAVLIRPGTGLVLTRAGGDRKTTWSVTATDLPAGRLLDVRRGDRPFVDAGTVRGALTLTASDADATFDLDLTALAARLPALVDDATEPPALGEPTDLVVKVAGTWGRAAGLLDIPRWSASMDGAALSGSVALRDLDTDPQLELALDVERMDFARLLRASGLQTAASLGAADGEDLGSATLDARAKGRFSDPASFVVTQKLEFTPPPRLPPAIAGLRAGFVFDTGAGEGGGRSLDVSPASADFIALADVPPLFVRTLLLGEDAGFYTHPGIDLREMPAALFTDWARGGAARGASTITQQLAKNLFLSRDKRLGRKLQELSLALLLESALGKNRILEIYLNVIEWGPNLFGLRPAARAYFDREPKDLTPAQMAFLVSLIPAPVKYQSSFAHGTPGPGLRRLVDALLAKLRSVDALTEEEYQRALDEEIVVRGRETRVSRRLPGALIPTRIPSRWNDTQTMATTRPTPW